MTLIRYTGDGVVFEGHAGDSAVCHGISAISQMVANYVDDNDWGDVVSSDGYLEIKNMKEGYAGNDLFRAMVQALREIELQYPRNVKIQYK